MTIKRSSSKFLRSKNAAGDEGKLRRRETSSTNPAQTKKIGRDFAESLNRKTRSKALVLGLVGELGGGKTTFLQGFARGLGIKEKINSPTFIIMRRIKNFYHFDCYRIKNYKEILELGWEKIISDPQNIVVIEWADRIKKILPKRTLWLRFKFINKNTRQIMLK